VHFANDQRANDAHLQTRATQNQGDFALRVH
jgi:hypothetical protein